MPAKVSGDGVATAIDEVPVTRERDVWTDNKNVKEAGVARANIAPTESAPNGSTDGDYANKHSHRTVLQQHVDFFDINKDGVITVYESYQGFRLIGWSIILAMIGALVTHAGLSYATLEPTQILPDPFLRIYVKNIHLGKHGSDTATYDNEGRFRPQLFEDIFSKFGSQDQHGEWGITFKQAMNSVYGNKCVMDPFGVFSAIFEWVATYLTIWPEDGVMRMEDVRGVYDGSYFYKLAEKKKPKRR